MIMAPIEVSVRWSPSWSTSVARISSSPEVTVVKSLCSEMLEPESNFSFPDVARHGPDSVIAPTDFISAAPETTIPALTRINAALVMTRPAAMVIVAAVVSTIFPSVAVVTSSFSVMVPPSIVKSPLVVTHAPVKRMSCFADTVAPLDTVLLATSTSDPPNVHVGVFDSVVVPTVVMVRLPPVDVSILLRSVLCAAMNDSEPPLDDVQSPSTVRTPDAVAAHDVDVMVALFSSRSPTDMSARFCPSTMLAAA